MRRGRPGQPFWPVRCRPTEGAGRLPKRTAVAGGPLRDSITAHSGVMAGLYEPRITNHEPLLFSDSDAATPRQTQTNNDASGSPQRVAGRPLTSQTAFGGQLPYKGSLVRPVARFHHSPSEYNGRLLRATSICHGTGYSHKSRRYALWDVPYGIAIRR